jgi:hypothetical protein
MQLREILTESSGLSGIGSNTATTPVQKKEQGPQIGDIPGKPKPAEKSPIDTVSISDEALKALNKEKQSTSTRNDNNAEELKEVQTLKKRDGHVRRHEMAHKMAGGTYTGQINYEYETGPDGKRYAVGGSISIDTSAENTPEQTLRKANIVRSAALAPSDPSMADRAVALKAEQMASKARNEIMEEQQKKLSNSMEQFTADFNAKGSDMSKAQAPVAAEGQTGPAEGSDASAQAKSSSFNDVQQMVESFASKNPSSSSSKSTQINPEDIQIQVSSPSSATLSDDRAPERPVERPAREHERPAREEVSRLSPAE